MKDPEIDEPIRVLHICGALAGGVGSVLLNYYRNVDRSRVQFDFLVHNEPTQEVQAEVETLGGVITVITPKSMSLLRNILETRDAINPKTPHSVLHVHTSSPTSFAFMMAGWLAGKRVRIAHSHTTWLEYAGRLQIKLHGFLRPVLRWGVTDMFACSKAAGEWLFGKRAVPSIVILPNAIELKQYIYDPEVRDSARRELGISDRIVFGHVGRFVHPKNHSFLINIFSEIAEIERQAILILLGDGELMGEVRAQVESLGLTDRVMFLGLRTDVADLLQAMDVFLLPSLFEGLPVVLVEAQVAGLPSLASSAVTGEIKLTSLVDFESLAEEPSLWAERALSMSAWQRDTKSHVLVAEAGYDIRRAGQFLTEFYIERVGSQRQRHRR